MSVCVYDSVRDCPFFCAYTYRGLTGRGRIRRWDMMAYGGKTGTTMKQSKETPLDLVGSSLHKNILSNADECCMLLFVYTVHAKSFNIYSYIWNSRIYYRIHTFLHLYTDPEQLLFSPTLFLLCLAPLRLCSSNVNWCFDCSSVVTNTLYISYNNHQPTLIFCWGKSASCTNSLN